MKSIKNYYIAAACCACAVLPGHMTAQEANDSTKANFFNAMDYIRQKRYIPEGRKVDPQAKGRNVSVSAFGGASKLAGEGSWMPMSKEFGVSLTKDVTSFNSYRLTLEGAQNKQMKRGGVEIAHLFRIMDYVWGYNDRTAWNVETVIGLGGYTTQMKKDGSRIMKMTEEHDCPFLAKNRLCYLVSAYGDSMLSETCQIFPREIHEFQDHKEATMMPCCPAVLDIWKEKKRIAFPETPKEKEQPLFLVRRKVMDLIMDPEKTPEEILLESFYVLKELHWNMPLTTELVEDYFSEKTIRQLEHAINEIELPVLDTMDECNELLQDLAVNYRKEGLYRKYLEPVMELAEELSEEYEEKELVEAREDFYRKFRVYEDLLRSFLANEVYSDLLTPEGDLEDALVHMQWIGMEYATIRQAVFLRWQKDGRGSLPYETLRDYMVVISRMTGYEEDDIREYLENSFEELLWEWGYFALITGK